MRNDLTIVLKKRWPEMLLIVGFMAIGIFLQEQLNASIPTSSGPGQTDALIEMSPATSFLYPMMAMIFCVLSLTLQLGFLATLNLNYDTPHDPTVLVRIGRFFFWRAIRFQLLFGIYCIAVATLLYPAMKFIFFRNITMENIPPWAFFCCTAIAILALLKPILFVMPIMICKNIMVLKATAAMSGYRISDAKPLVAIFIIGICTTASITLLHMNMDPNTLSFDILIAIKSILLGIFYLLIGIVGIWFVAGKQFGKLREIEAEPEAETQE